MGAMDVYIRHICLSIHVHTHVSKRSAFISAHVVKLR